MEKYSTKSIIEDATAVFLKTIVANENDLLDFLEGYILALDAKRGELIRSVENTKALAGFEAAILEFIKSSDFAKDAEKYLSILPELYDITDNFHIKENGYIVPSRLRNEVFKAASVVAATQTTGAAFSANVSAKFQNILFTAVTRGGSLRDILKEVRAISKTNVEKAGVIGSHITQISRDLLNQSVGAYNDAIAAEAGMDAYIYINSIIDTTRPQCKRWRKMRILKIENLEKEINWAYRHGSGMIKGTNIFNFSKLRGGNNCRHEALPTFS